MLENGKYSAWFRTPLGEGTGVVLLKDGLITGGDTVLAYTGSYNQDGDTFTVDIATRRHTPGQLSVFGIDNVDLTLVGKSSGRWRRVVEQHGKRPVWRLKQPSFVWRTNLVRLQLHLIFAIQHHRHRTAVLVDSIRPLPKHCSQGAG